MLRQGRFYPELTLGAGALSASRRTEIGQFLHSVVQSRGLPLHLANLWNALYFNYDLDYGGFRVDHIDPKRIPTRTATGRDWSLPIGGFVRIHTEMQCGDLFAEVVYKEGAHPDVSEDWVEACLSGAPTTQVEEIGDRKIAIVRERFVFDLNAFGPTGNAVTPKQYERLCRKAHWLDAHGHLVIDAMYAPDTADLDDLDFYVDYLMKEHREGLLAFCFSEELNDVDLREALLRSFDAVRAIALSSQRLQNWREKYFFAANEYEWRLSSNDVLGGDDLATIFTGLVRLPRSDRRSYSALGPRLLELLGRNDSDDIVLVYGSAYAAAVCHANVYTAERLAREQKQGVLPCNVHLRLDDDWQAGGIWRAEGVDDPHRYSLSAVPPTLPLGLGYVESRSAPDVAEPATGEEQPVPSSQTGFKVALTLRDRALGRLRLPPVAAAALAQGPVDVVVWHGGTRTRRSVTRDGSSLYGVEYQWELHPGIVLGCNVESRGSVVRVRTLPIAPPIVAPDGASFDYQTRISVYERAMLLTRLSPRERATSPSLRDLCNQAFRVCGRQRPDGTRALTLSELAVAVLGPAWRSTDMPLLAKALNAMDLERDGDDYLWQPRATTRTRASDRSLLAAYGETRARGKIARSVRRHWVPMHLRHYTRRSPSPLKRETYAEARIRYGMHGVFPEELPAGYTWVEPYSWGTDSESE